MILSHRSDDNDEYRNLPRIPKLLDQRLPPLNIRIAQGTNLVTVELGPPLAHRAFDEGNDGSGSDEIDEGVPDVAVVLEVHAKVEEVVLAFVGFVEKVNEHLLGGEGIEF